MRTLIAGIGYRWQGDGSFGLVASDELARLTWPDGVEIADLGYGAIYAAQDLGSADPPYRRLILLSAAQRGRDAGRLYVSHPRVGPLRSDDVLSRIREAGAGVIDLDHLLVIAQHFQTLPPRVVVIELEPEDIEPAVDLSPAARDLLPEVLGLIREELATSGATAPGGSVHAEAGQQGEPT